MYSYSVLCFMMCFIPVLQLLHLRRSVRLQTQTGRFTFYFSPKLNSTRKLHNKILLFTFSHSFKLNVTVSLLQWLTGNKLILDLLGQVEKHHSFPVNQHQRDLWISAMKAINTIYNHNYKPISINIYINQLKVFKHVRTAT